MLIGGDRSASAASRQDQHDVHPLDQFIPDPTGRPPLCDEGEFAEVLEGGRR
jgi:hypothetical protein